MPKSPALFLPFFVVALGAMSGCSSLSEDRAAAQPTAAQRMSAQPIATQLPATHRMTENDVFVLPSVPCPKDFEEQQLLDFHWQKGKGTLLTVETCRDGRMTIHGLTPSGLELFQIDYDARQVNFVKKVIASVDIPVQEILFDAMATRLPLKALAENFPSDWRVTERVSPNETNRVIEDGKGNPVESFIFNRHEKDSDGTRPDVIVRHHRFGYTVEIRKLIDP